MNKFRVFLLIISIICIFFLFYSGIPGSGKNQNGTNDQYFIFDFDEELQNSLTISLFIYFDPIPFEEAIRYNKKGKIPENYAYEIKILPSGIEECFNVFKQIEVVELNQIKSSGENNIQMLVIFSNSRRKLTTLGFGGGDSMLINEKIYMKNLQFEALFEKFIPGIELKR